MSVLTRSRRLIRSLAKPAAMVGVVGILSLSLIVTTPSNAQAFSDGDLLQKAAPRIAGAVKTIAPVAGTVAAVATSVTPLGWVIKGGYSLAMLAFSTSDIWMPYVTGQFGQPTDAPPSAPAASGARTIPGLSVIGLKSALNSTTLHPLRILLSKV